MISVGAHQQTNCRSSNAAKLRRSRRALRSHCRGRIIQRSCRQTAARRRRRSRWPSSAGCFPERRGDDADDQSRCENHEAPQELANAYACAISRTVILKFFCPAFFFCCHEPPFLIQTLSLALVSASIQACAQAEQLACSTSSPRLGGRLPAPPPPPATRR